jgi:hypothetical protein
LILGSSFPLSKSDSILEAELSFPQEEV